MSKEKMARLQSQGNQIGRISFSDKGNVFIFFPHKTLHNGEIIAIALKSL
jgi:hypothetical protein